MVRDILEKGLKRRTHKVMLSNYFQETKLKLWRVL